MATRDVEAIAPEIDRLVWAVSTSVRARHQRLPSSSKLKADTFGPLINLLPFRDHLTDALIKRRYLYRPAPAVAELLDDLVATELVIRNGDRLVPTSEFDAIAAEVNAAIDDVCRGLWSRHESTVLAATDDARNVLEASEDRDGLVSLAQDINEAADPLHRFWQRLTGLRLVRNEAHVHAWRRVGLGPRDVEVLTGAWAGTALQSPGEASPNLVALGYVADGEVTRLGLAARQEIEDATDNGVSQAFDAVDTAAFLSCLSTLPPWD